MRIGYDAKRLFCNFTGLGNYSRTLVKNLRSNFPLNDYLLYTPKVLDSSETDPFFDEVKYKVHLSTAFVKSIWRSYSMVKQLKKDGVQLYHGLSHELPFRIQKSGIKSVVTIHDLIFKVYPTTYAYFDRTIDNVKFKNACANADKIVAISENTKKDIVNFYGIDPAKITVVYQSCDPLYFEESKEKEETDRGNKVFKEYDIPSDYLLYVGSVQERKNLKLIIEAYNHLVAASIEFKVPLVIVGKGGKYKEEVLQMIKLFKLENLIIWLDKLEDNHTLKALYQNSKALVYPSFYEGFGLPVAEALLCKTPVITAGVSSLPEAGGPNSIYIDPHNHQELAGAIRQVLEDEETVSAMKEKGYEYALQKFSPEVVCKQMMKVYEGVVL
jgi:glycosyltransferase involved in cell wall biosynthesis